MYMGYMYYTDYISNIGLLHMDDPNKGVSDAAKSAAQAALDKSNIQLEAKVDVGKEAAQELAKGISNVGSNLGLAATIGGMAAAVSKAIAKSALPPTQKAAIVMGSGFLGAAIHTGATAINSQTALSAHITRIKAEAAAKAKAEIMANNESNQALAAAKAALNSPNTPKGSSSFMPNLDIVSPLKSLLNVIYIINALSLLFFVIVLIQFSFRYMLKDKPDLDFLSKLFPVYAKNIKSYIHKLIYINKKTGIY